MIDLQHQEIQGILGFIAALLPNEFFIECYTPLGDLMDILALLNCSINFLLYCLMSRQFRLTFRKICGLPVDQADQANTRQCERDAKFL